jgi:SH3 domain-containing YSC84-like protein 1
MKKNFLALGLIAFMALPVPAADSKECDRIESAGEVAKEIMDIPDDIPQNVIDKADCVVVMPSVIKGAFIVGASYGRGLMTCRSGDNFQGPWGAPTMMALEGGSFGFQIGGQATDLVIVAVNQKGFQDLLKNKVKLGGDAAASAGPVGRNAQAGTDWKLNAELLTYSRSKGLFAGIDLTGDDVSQNLDDTTTFYNGSNNTFDSILHGNVAVPDSAKPFVRTVAKYFHSTQDQ